VPVGIGTWTKVSGPGNVAFTPNANTPNALVAVTAYGSYTFRWTVVNGTCSNSATVSVNFIQQAAANAGSGGSECDRDFIFNAVTTAGTGTWTKVSGPGNAVFSPDSHQPNAKVTVDQFGTYRFAWTVVNITCTSSDVVDVVFHALPSINAGTDTEVCKGGSIQLNAQGVGTYAWSPAALVNNPAIRNPIATPVTSTTFTVVLTDQFGCKNSDGVLVEVREKTVAEAGPDQLLEYLFETTMDAVLTYPYETGVWSVISGAGRFNDKNLPKTFIDSLSVGVNKFLWTVTNRVCPTSSDSVSIEVKDFIIPTLITPNMDGINDYFVLRGLSTLGKTELIIFDRRGAQVYKNSNYDNSWNGVDYNENPLADGTYYYVLKAENGKSLSGYIVIRR
jgi:gliding motility-associated-like protein